MGLKAIFIDVHGVLVDFFAGLTIRTGVEFPPCCENFHECLGMSEETMWRTLNREDFWRELPVFPHATTMLHAVADLDIPFYVCTRPMFHSPKAIKGTVDLLMEELGVPFTQIVITSDKAVCAQGAFLIDDQPDNCKRWRKYGGRAFEWPCLFNDYRRGQYSQYNLKFAMADMLAEILIWIHN